MTSELNTNPACVGAHKNFAYFRARAHKNLVLVFSNAVPSKNTSRQHITEHHIGLHAFIKSRGNKSTCE